MPKQPQDQVEDELQQQDDDVYGTGYTDGGPDKFIDTEEMVKNVTGNDPDPERDGFEMEEEVEKDDDAVEDGAGTPGYPGSVDEDDVESELEKLEKERDKEDSSDE